MVSMPPGFLDIPCADFYILLCIGMETCGPRAALSMIRLVTDMAARAGYYTDKGTVKPVNEDSLLVRTARTVNGPLALAAVCDGMGGLARGELASAAVVRALSDWFDGELPQLLEGGYDFAVLRSGIEYEIYRVSRQLEEYSRRHSMRMGTTLTMALLYAGKCVTANVGDSRVYALTDTMRQLTEDHSLVQRDVRTGLLRPEDAERDERRNILTQCVGVSMELAPDIRQWDMSPGAVYLLCSDGFRHELTPEEIYPQVRAGTAGDGAAMGRVLESLARTAMDRGETDNITAAAVWISDSEG